MKFKRLDCLILIKRLFLGVLTVLILSCSSTSKKEEEQHIKSSEKTLEQVSETTQVKTETKAKTEKLMVQDKWDIAQKLRLLQYEVHGLEDKIFGNETYGFIGLHGVYRQCHIKLAQPKNGGNGNIRWMEPIDRITKKKEKSEMIGLNDRNKIIKIKEEFLKKRIKRFLTYRETLQKKQKEYNNKIEVCHLKLKMQKEKITENKKNL